MCLLDDVRLIESKILAPPIVSAFERLTTRPASFELGDKYYCRPYWAHALIRYYLKTGRKYVLTEKYALNKYVRLLTRPYGS